MAAPNSSFQTIFNSALVASAGNVSGVRKYPCRSQISPGFAGKVWNAPGTENPPKPGPHNEPIPERTGARLADAVLAPLNADQSVTNGEGSASSTASVSNPGFRRTFAAACDAANPTNVIAANARNFKRFMNRTLHRQWKICFLTAQYPFGCCGFMQATTSDSRSGLQL